MPIAKWRAPHQGAMFPWLKAVFDNLSGFLSRSFATIETDITAIETAIGSTGGIWHRTAAQTLTSGSNTPISWTGEVLDTDGFLTPTSTTWTCRSTGAYVMTYGGFLTLGTRGLAYFDVTTSVDATYASLVGGSSAPTRMSINTTEDRFLHTAVFYLALNDTVTFNLTQVDGVDRDASSCWLSTWKIPHL